MNNELMDVVSIMIISLPIQSEDDDRSSVKNDHLKDVSPS